MRNFRSAVIHPISYKDKAEWLAFRSNGIGGSEACIVMGESEYSSPAKLFHEKIGLLSFPDIDNEVMFLGRFMEEHIATLWKYWWQDRYIENYTSQTPVRKCLSLNGYGVNPKYPWLFASLDRYIPAGQMSLDGVELTEGGILEIKTIGMYASANWSHEIPRSYPIQVHQYMLVYGVDYAEIAYLQGGNKLYVLPIHYSDIIGDRLIEVTHDFWYNRVVPAQALVQEYRQLVFQGKEKMANQCLMEIDQYEPDSDSTLSYREIMNMKKRDSYTHEYTAADSELKNKAIRHKACKEMVKALTELERGMSNEMISFMNRHQSEYVRFGEEDGYMRFYTKNNATAPTFDNRIKMVAEMERLKEVFNALLDKADSYMGKKQKK